MSSNHNTSNMNSDPDPLGAEVILPISTYFVCAPITTSSPNPPPQSPTTLHNRISIDDQMEFAVFEVFVKHNPYCPPIVREQWRWEYFLTARKGPHRGMHCEITGGSWVRLRDLVFEEESKGERETFVLKAVVSEPEPESEDDSTDDDGAEEKFDDDSRSVASRSSIDSRCPMH